MTVTRQTTDGEIEPATNTDVDDAREHQERLEQHPTKAHERSGTTRIGGESDPDAPGQTVDRPLGEADDVEPNEPA